jgi:hypothetical protein
MGKYRAGSISRNRMRNLVQYRNMTDEEFDDAISRLGQGISQSVEYEKRIEKKIGEFGSDYDLNDLKINDMLTLRALAQAYITLEDYERYAYNVRSSEEGLSLDIMIEMEKLNSIMSSLRKDISNLQTDLNITRKLRKGDKQESVISEVERLKEKAKEFYEQRMSYIFCDKCNMLLATAWFHYPYGRNKLSFTCNRELENGEKCGNVVTVTSKDLMEKRGVNTPSIVPESFK